MTRLLGYKKSRQSKNPSGKVEGGGGVGKVGVTKTGGVGIGAELKSNLKRV